MSKIQCLERFGIHGRKSRNFGEKVRYKSDVVYLVGKIKSRGINHIAAGHPMFINPTTEEYFLLPDGWLRGGEEHIF